MKPIIFICLFWCSLCTTQAQVVPNGGFEEWDTSAALVPYPYPLNWIWFHSVPLSCLVPVNMTIEPSDMSSSGCCSVKLTTQNCRKGTVYSGDLNASMPWVSAVGCEARPAQLNFQYMFDPVGGDSAFVRVHLFSYDSITPGLSYSQRMDMVGIGSAHLIEQASSFTLFNMPIEYLSADTPAFMNIQFFSSSPGSQSHSGTSLWIDDVGFSGTVDIQETSMIESITVFPNPAGDRIWFKGQEITGEMNVLVFDRKGAQVLDERITDPKAGLDVSRLRSGVFSIVLQSRDGRSLRTTWVKE